MRSWLLNLVPRCMRRWPWLRRYYWQPEDLDAASRKAEELLAEFYRRDGGVR